MAQEENQHSNSDNLKETKDEKDTANTDDNFNPEEKIKKLEDRLARAYAEIENQQRRLENEKNWI